MTRSKGRAGTTVMLAALVSIGGAQGSAAQAARVESQVLVVGEPGLQYSISPKGQHLGAVVLRGSRQVFVHDGVDGPRFDEILDIPNTGGMPKVAWSDDGGRYAYYGRVGPEFLVMVDGKEAHRGPWSGELASESQAPVQVLGFTPGGKHWYLIVHTRTVGRDHWQMFVDGKPGPVGESRIQPLWSRDGEHHAYILERNPTNGPRSSALIHDGKPLPYLAGDLQFTADGLHLFSQRVIPRGNGMIEVLADGQPFMRAQGGLTLYMAPTGAGVLGTVPTTLPSGSRSMFVTIGNRKVPGSDCNSATGGGIDAVYLSPDGKHFAARCSSSWMLVDGKRSMEYPGGFSSVVFTSNGKAVYTASTNNKHFMIIGDRESDGYDRFVPDNRKTRITGSTVNYQPPPAVIQDSLVAYIGWLGQGSLETVVVVGDQAFKAVNATEVSLSPDGRRHAFISGRLAQFVTLDGVAIPELTVDAAVGNIGYQGNIHWTEDSRHVAWIASPQGGSRGIAIDGKFMAAPGMVRYLQFTRDGKHLVWLVRAPPGHVVFVDGEPVLELPHHLPLENDADIYWNFAADGSVTLVAQDGNEMKRFRIIPGAGTSVATLVAKAVTPR